MSQTDYESRKTELAKEIIADYEHRREERRQFEAQWRVNASFVSGKQSCYRVGGSVIEEDKRRFYEERAVFNHVAGVYEARLGKLGRLRPHLTVRPPRGDDDAVLGSRLSGAVLESACERVRLPDLIAEATAWSELTGTAFYKVSWDRRLGRIAGEMDGEFVHEGEVRVDVVSPYEIFPDSVYAPSVEACRSIIHAKALPITEIAETWGKTDLGEGESFTAAEALALTGEVVSLPSGYALVLERFTRGTDDNPRGKYEVVAGGELVYEGELPFGSGELPFIRQCCTAVPGKFFGVSPIERAVPIQRAYNAVKNRKHEFMNRLAAGVLVVEDGSVDVDDLEEGGLEPGKIIVYRQGATAPSFLPMGELPADFKDEEEKLLEEISATCGVSELMRSNAGSVTSGSAIQLLIEQDDVRLAVASDNIAKAVRSVGRRMLDLYAECSGCGRLRSGLGMEGDGLWSGSDLVCREVAVECSPELEGTRPNRRALVLELYRAGLFDSESGKVSEPTRRRILQALGYGYIEQSSVNRSLHEARASRENVGALPLEVKPYDDHAAHVEEHVAYLLEKDLSPEVEADLIAHVEQHKVKQKEENNGKL